METKLTLKLNKNAIDEAKLYARQTNQSLSSLVQKYFITLSEKHKESQTEISPIVRELSGIMNLDKEVDVKEEYHHHILEKYA